MSLTFSLKDFLRFEFVICVGGMVLHKSVESCVGRHLERLRETKELCFVLGVPLSSLITIPKEKLMIFIL